jgi:hypothetical protein
MRSDRVLLCAALAILIATAPTVARAGAPAEASAPPPPWSAWATSGGGAALLVTGIVLGSAASKAARTIEAQQDVSSPRPFSAELRAAERRGQALGTAGAVLDIVGAVALAAGVIATGAWLYRRAYAPRPALSLAPQGAGLLLSGSF